MRADRAKHYQLGFCCRPSWTNKVTMKKHLRRLPQLTLRSLHQDWTVKNRRNVKRTVKILMKKRIGGKEVEKPKNLGRR